MTHTNVPVTLIFNDPSSRRVRYQSFGSRSEAVAHGEALGLESYEVVRDSDEVQLAVKWPPMRVS